MLDQAHRYVFVLRNPSRRGKDILDAYLLLTKLEDFANGAIGQINRVERDKRSIEKSVRRRREMGKFPKASIARLFMDAHFYFICIGHVNKFLKQLARMLNNSKLKKIHGGLEREFSREIRNHLEHLDERVVGRHAMGREIVNADAAVVDTWKRDFVNFVGDELSFGGKKYAVNAEAGKKLRETYKKVIAVIREDYALKDRRFVQDEMRDKWLRTVVRKVTKAV